jgi:hypothetical protein
LTSSKDQNEGIANARQKNRLNVKGKEKIKLQLNGNDSNFFFYKMHHFTLDTSIIDKWFKEIMLTIK